MVAMTKLKINLTQTAPAASRLTATVVGVQGSSKDLKLTKNNLDSKLTVGINLETLGVSADVGSIKKLSGPGSSIIALVGIGKTLEIDPIRQAMGAAARELGNFEHVVIDIPLASKDLVLAAIEGFQLGNYEYLTYKPKATKKVLSKLTILTSLKPTAGELAQLEVYDSSGAPHPRHGQRTS
jgi:leucyl aminopeptidase